MTKRDGGRGREGSRIMGNSVAGESLPGCYTVAQAIKLSGITPVVFAWIVHTERIQVPRIGNRAVYTPEVVNQVLQYFHKKDPDGRFLCKQKRPHGPKRQRREKATQQAGTG